MTKESIYRMLDMGCYRGLIAAGPAGTGKSTDPLIYCAKNEIPVIVFQCTPGTDEDVLLGKWQPKEGEGNSKFLELINNLTTKLSVLSKEEMLDIVKTYEVTLNDSINNYIFQPGPLSLGVIYDCFVVINEANYMPSANFSTLNSLMDDNAQLLLPNGRVIKRGKNFRLILTVNPGYRGTNMFNEATLNRFATVYYEPITKKILIERLKQESGYKNEKVLEAVAEQFDKLRGIYQSKNMETEVTYRNTIRFLRMLLLASDKPIEKQFDMAFVNNAVFEMNDIQVELTNLKEVRKDLLSDIKSALAEGTEEVVEASWTCSPQVNIDDLTSQIGDDGSLLEFEKEEE
jgi:MoxR-like ATPase